MKRQNEKTEMLLPLGDLAEKPVKAAKRAGKPRLKPLVRDGEKRCLLCQQVKPIKQFARFRTKDEYTSACLECDMLPYQATFRHRDGGFCRRSTMENTVMRYGLSVRQYKQIRDRQANRCAACNRQSTLVIDHDHATGKVRGLLCVKCNVTLGKMKDKPPAGSDLEKYLKINIEHA